MRKQLGVCGYMVVALTEDELSQVVYVLQEQLRFPHCPGQELWLMIDQVLPKAPATATHIFQVPIRTSVLIKRVMERSSTYCQRFYVKQPSLLFIVHANKLYVL